MKTLYESNQSSLTEDVDWAETPAHQILLFIEGAHHHANGIQFY